MFALLLQANAAYAAAQMHVSANVVQAITLEQNADGTYTVPDGVTCEVNSDTMMCYY